MPIKVESTQPDSKTVAWKDVKQGEIYRSGDYLVYAAGTTVHGRPLQAVALQDCGTQSPGNIWTPGEASVWTQMDATLLISPSFKE